MSESQHINMHMCDWKRDVVTAVFAWLADILVTYVGSSGGGVRNVWPQSPSAPQCMSSSLVWVQRCGPSHPWTAYPGPLHDKPLPTASHSQSRKWQPLVQLQLPEKTERFPFSCTSQGAVIASALSVGVWVAEDMSGSCQSPGWTRIPLWSGAL